VQRVKALLPEVSVVTEPGIKFGERLGAKIVDAPLRLVVHLDQPRFSQYAQVARDSGPGDRQPLSQFPYSGGASP
jgi:hypothetical protein